MYAVIAIVPENLDAAGKEMFFSQVLRDESLMLSVYEILDRTQYLTWSRRHITGVFPPNSNTTNLELSHFMQCAIFEMMTASVNASIIMHLILGKKPLPIQANGSR